LADSKHINLIEMRNISKSFGKVIALKNINFKVSSNEVVGLIGDNGAGKSTLIKILMGVYPPDAGEVFIRDMRIHLSHYSAKVAHKLRIEAVYQEKALGEKQPLWRNIFLGRQITNKLGFIDVKKEREETERIMKNLIGFRSKGISSESRVSELSGGERQGVSIGRAMYFDADLIILDEPTTALSVKEVGKVINFIKQIKDVGKSCIMISHNMSEEYSVADRYVILDRGEIVGEYKKEDVTLSELTSKLIRIADGNAEKVGA
jgi:simple sugar transport system ATP-binding protein